MLEPRPTPRKPPKGKRISTVLLYAARFEPLAATVFGRLRRGASRIETSMGATAKIGPEEYREFADFCGFPGIPCMPIWSRRLWSRPFAMPFTTNVVKPNDIYVSAASVWEIGIKYALGKPSAPPFSAQDAISYFTEAGFISLPVTAAHAAAAEELPPIHADPFDRILVAQAISEPLRLISRDAKVAAYGSAVLSW